jgi:hypothetical protein
MCWISLERVPGRDNPFQEEIMPSLTVQESLHPHTPETSYHPVLSATQSNRGLDSWRETRWFVKREEDELAGYFFADDSEVRPGAD